MRFLRFLALTLLMTALLATPAISADSAQFRGPDRDGIYPESGLAKKWPASGPKLLWSAKDLGESYASVTVVDGTLYTTGKFGDEGRALAFDRNGKLLWSTVYGGEHKGGGYPGSRTTPTYDGGSLYLLSSNGEAVALDAKSGKMQWKVDLFKRFGGKNIYFGVSEAPLVDGDRVIVTAGGKDASVVALNRKTGETVWSTKGLSDSAAYCSARVMEHGKQRQIVTSVGKHLVGIAPETGEVLWRQKVEVSYDIHANSPLFLSDLIYTTHGYGQGGRAFRLAADGRSVSPAWTEEELDVHHGGAVLVDGRIYGAASNKAWHVLNAKTGAQLAKIKRLGKGSVVYADGLLYGYVESGEVLLVNPSPESFEVISRFKMEAGSGHHWSHPVIADKVLYIRHGDVLHAYDVAAPAAQKQGSAGM